MEHEPLKELIALAALDRLEPEERAALDAHLALGCDECERDLRSFQGALGAWVCSESDEGDVGAVWRRLENRLAAVAPKADPQARSERNVLGGERRRIARWRAGAGMAVAAALAFLIVAVDFGSQLAHRDQHSHHQIALLRRRVQAMQKELDNADHQISSLRIELDVRSHLTRAMLSPDVHVIRLEPLAPAPQAAGIVTLSQAARTAAFQAAGLPPVPPDRIYELWWIGSRSGPLKAGLFRVSPLGDASILATMPPEGEKLLASAVTLEPAGGVPKPTGAAYLKGAAASRAARMR